MRDDRKSFQWVRVSWTSLTRLREGVFEFRKDRGWRWLQRLCLWTLKKIGAHADETIQVFTRTPRQNDDLLKALMGQELTWLELIHREGPCRIYMGPDGHDDLVMMMHDMNMQPTMIGHAAIEIREGRHQSKWHNIPITVVPWMKGAVLVPAALQ